MAVNLTKGKSEYTVRYSDFCGVDLTGDGSAIDERTQFCERNMNRKP